MILSELTKMEIGFLIAPILITFILFFINDRLKFTRWKNVHLTAQWSALFYFVAVVILIEKIYSLRLFGTLLIVFIIFLSIHLIVQRKKDTDISLKKALIVLLRFIFLLFSVLYIVFMITYSVIIYNAS